MAVQTEVPDDGRNSSGKPKDGGKASGKPKKRVKKDLNELKKEMEFVSIHYTLHPL